MTEEARFLRRLYSWSFATRVSIGLLGWFATRFINIPLLQDAVYYETVAAGVANDWLHGRHAVWLQEARPHDPYLMVVMLACCYTLTLGTRSFPLLIIVYSSVTSFMPKYVFLIGRQLGASPSSAAKGAWLVALLPAFAFWSGALYKEGLVLLILAIIVYHAMLLQTGWRGRSLGILVAGITGLLFLRFYLSIIVAGTVGLGLCMGHSRPGQPARGHLVLIRQAILVLLFVAGLTAFRFTEIAKVIPADSGELLGQIQLSRYDLALTNSGYLGSTEMSTPGEAIRFLPLGLSHFLAVPFPWQFGSLRQNLAIPDTLIMVLLYPLILVGMLRGMQRNAQGTLLLVGISVALCCLYALLISNIGAAYRLRIQVWMLWCPFVGIGLSRPRVSAPLGAKYDVRGANS